MAETDKPKAKVTVNGHPVPERVWIDFRDKPANRYWRVHTAPNAFANVGYVRFEQLTRLREAAQRALDSIVFISDRLDQWARQSVEGGWSTHQVDPMRKQADVLRREAAQIREALTQRAAGGES